MTNDYPFVENPIIGHKVIFRQTAADTNGELLQIEYVVYRPEQPFQYIPMHLHHIVSERFEVLSGLLGVAIGQKTDRRILTSGEEVMIPTDTPHAFWNAGDSELRFFTDIRPAWRLQTYWETAFGLARDGKVNRQGIPNLLQVAVLAPVMDTYLPNVPVGIQKALFGSLGLPGRMLGYRASYPQYRISQKKQLV